MGQKPTGILAHFPTGASTAYGETNAKGREQYEKYRQVLRGEHGGVKRVIRGLRYLRGKHPRRRQIRMVLGYFLRHRHRMDYAGAAKRGLPIGSGVVEAACKTLVTERLKRSGMRWREAGGQAILTLRGWVQSGRFEAAWTLLAATYRDEVRDAMRSSRPTAVPPDHQFKTHTQSIESIYPQRFLDKIRQNLEKVPAEGACFGGEFKVVA